MVLIACCKSLSMHLTSCGQHRRQEDHRHVPVQSSCHLSPGDKATNRIIDATERLTAAIAGIQDAPPNEMEAIQSLRTTLLGKVAPLPSPALSILPMPQVRTPLVNINKSVII
jgi:hypothetical protein